MLNFATEMDQNRQNLGKDKDTVRKLPIRKKGCKGFNSSKLMKSVLKKLDYCPLAKYTLR